MHLTKFCDITAVRQIYVSANKKKKLASVVNCGTKKFWLRNNYCKIQLT